MRPATSSNTIMHALETKTISVGAHSPTGRGLGAAVCNSVSIVAIRLANGTEMRAALGYPNALDRPPAARTWLSIPSVDSQVVLEVAVLTIGCAVIAEQRAPLVDRIVEHLA